MSDEVLVKNLLAHSVPPLYLERIPLRFAREHAVVAIDVLEKQGNLKFVLACGYPDRRWVINRIAYKLDAEVEIVHASPEEIEVLLSRSYHAEAKEVDKIASELSAENSGGEIHLSEDVLELDDKAPAIKLVHAMLLQAVKQRASDIHVEPNE